MTNFNPKDPFLISIKKAINDFKEDIKIEEEAVVLSIFDGVAKAVGLEGGSCMDLVEFKDSKAKGMIMGINSDSVDIILLDKINEVKEGEYVKSMGKKVSIPVGTHLLGRVVDVLGRPLDDGKKIEEDLLYDLERPSPEILDRKSIHEPMETGILCIDAAIPIGRGQRELIIGDRQTGKTSIAIDTIINQGLLNKTRSDREKVYSVYVAIGQKRSTIVNIIELLKAKGVFEYCVIVVASASDSAAMQFLAPYSGSSIAEYFRDNGQHSLIVYDDLTTQAIAYREISLLLRRSPAREAYPGDIFYLHARLLERSGKLSDEKGAGSMTALPIIETQAGDVSAYIPTNVISITDGQIFLESDLFYQGVRPAINIGISVSRVGSAAQRKAIKELAGSMKVKLAQFREIEVFSKFSSDLDDTTLKILENGKKTVSVLVQPNYKPVAIEEEILLLFLLSDEKYSKLNSENIKSIAKEVRVILLETEKVLLNDLLTDGYKKHKEKLVNLVEVVLKKHNLI